MRTGIRTSSGISAAAATATSSGSTARTTRAPFGHITNPVDGGWRNIGLEIEQVSPTTLVTTYLFEGGLFTHNGFTTTTHTDIAAGPNFVSDIALFSMNMGSTTEVGHGYYDNYRVAIVPEPATALLLVAGAAGVCARRRVALAQ